MLSSNPATDIDPFKNYSDLRKIGIWSLAAAVASCIIFGNWLSIMAAIYGAYGAYLSISQKERWSTILLNVLAAVIGVTSKLMLMKASGGEFVIGSGQGTPPLTPLIYLLVTWAVILVLLIAAWVRSPRYAKEDLAADPGREAPAFSSTMGRAFTLSKILFYVAAISMGWYLIPTITQLRRGLYADSDTVTLLVPGFASLAMFLPIVLISLITAVTFRKVIAQFFPRFDQFYSLKNYVDNRTVGLSQARRQDFWNAALKQIDLIKLARRGWHGLFVYDTVAWILFGLTFIPLMDCYVKINQSSIAANPLMGFQEIVVPWEGLSARVEMIQEKFAGRKARFRVTHPDGTKIDLWACVGLERNNSMDLLKIIPVLKNHHIPIEVFAPAGETQSGETGENVRLIKEVFEAAKQATPEPPLVGR